MNHCIISFNSNLQLVAVADRVMHVIINSLVNS